MKKILTYLALLPLALTFATKAVAQCSDCTLYIEMEDGYGDGWNGNAVTISQNGVLVGTFTLSDGYSGSSSMGVCKANGTLTIDYGGGEYPDENSFVLTDQNGNVLAQCSDGSKWSGSVEAAPCSNCLMPQLTLLNVDETTASVSWEEGGMATSWMYRLGDDDWTSTSSTSLDFDALAPGVVYTLQVQAVCGDDEMSSVASLTFATLCAKTPLPLTEGFEYFDSETMMPMCWDRLEAFDSYGEAYPAASNYGAAHGGNYAMIFMPFYANNTVAAPILDVDASKLEVSMYISSSSYGNLQVGYIPAASSSPDDFVLVDVIQISNDGSYHQYKVSFADVDYSGDFRVVLHMDASSGYNYYTIDDVTFRVVSNCPEVTGIVTDGFSGSGNVALSWNSDGTNFEVAYGPVGFNPDGSDAGVMQVDGTHDCVVSGLDDAIIYDFYVRSVCGDEKGYWGAASSSVRPNTYWLNQSADTVSSCDFYIVDNGGPAGDYKQTALVKVVVYPEEEGKVLRITGSYVGSYSNYAPSPLVIYDGDSANAPVGLQFTNGSAEVNFRSHGPVTLTFSAANGSSFYVDEGFDLHVVCVDPSFCSEIDDFKVVEAAVDEATFSWSPWEEPDMKYVIELVDVLDPDSTVYSYDIDPGLTEATITGLAERTSYRATIHSVCAAGDGFKYSTTFVTRCGELGEMPVGDPETSNSNMPTTASYNYSIVQTIYSRSEFDHPVDTVYGIVVNMQQVVDKDIEMSIYMDITEDSAYEYSSDYISMGPSQLVYNGVRRMNVGENEIVFDKPWISSDTSKNIVITYLSHIDGAIYNNTQRGRVFTTDDGRLRSMTGSGSGVITPGNGYNYPTTTNQALALVFLEPCGRVLCSAPVIAVGDVSANSISVSWTPGYDETAWSVEYRKESDEDWTVLSESTSQLGADITGLSQGTWYQIRVTSLCGEKNHGRTVRVATDCGVFGVPFVESFENFDASSLSKSTQLCWDRVSHYPYNTTYPYVDSYASAYDGNRSLYMDYYGSSLILPELTTPVEQLQLSAYVRKSYETPNTVRLEVGVCGDPDDDNSFVVIDDVEVASNEYTLVELPLDKVGAAEGRIFVRGATGGALNFYLDSLAVDVIPACRSIKAASYMNFNHNSVTINIDDDVEREGYIVYYNTADSFAGATPFSTTSKQPVVTGLSSSTTYYMWVVASCGDSQSKLLKIGSISTMCDPIEVSDDNLYSNDLEEASATGCFKYLPVGSNRWVMGAPSAYNDGYVHSGATALSFIPNNNKEAFVFLPAFDFSGMTVDADFGFYRYSAHEEYSSASASHLKVYYRTSADGDWTLVKECDHDVINSWSHELITLPASQGAAFYQVRLGAYGNETGSGYVYVDDIEIKPYSDCRAPEAVVVSDITERAAKTSWTAGESSSFRVQFRNELDWSWITYNVDDSASVTLCPLEHSSTYQVRVASRCADGVVSEYSPVTIFQTPFCDSVFSLTSFAQADEKGTHTISANSNGVYYEVVIPADEVDNSVPIERIFFTVAEPLPYDAYYELYVSPSIGSSFATFKIDYNNAAYLDGYIDSGYVGEISAEFESPLQLEAGKDLVIGMVVETQYYEYDYETYEIDYVRLDHVFASHKSDTREARYYDAGDDYLYVYDLGNLPASLVPATDEIVDFVLAGCKSVCWEPVVRQTTSSASSIIVDWVKEKSVVELAIKRADEASFGAPVSVASGHVYTFENLIPQTEYDLRIRANCSNSGSGYTDWAEFSVATDTACSIPASLQVSNVTAHTATLTWDAGDMHNNHWDIHVWNDGFDTIYDTKSNPATIGGLLPGNDYRVQLRSYCGSDDHVVSEWSEIRHIQNTCAPVTGVKAEASGDNVTVSWVAGERNKKWLVAYGLKDFTGNEAIEYRTVTENHVTFEGLKRGNTYSFRVLAFCDDDWTSEWSGNANVQMVGIDEVDGPRLSLQPNPAAGFVTLGLEGAEGTATVTILTVDGRQMSQFTTSENTLRVSLDQYAAGTYFVRVQTEGWTATRKLVVK